jgi:hypothetical protein
MKSNMSAGSTMENQTSSAIDSSEIQSLNSEVSILQKSSNNWNIGYLVVTGLAVVVAIAALYSQFRALQITRELGSKQAQLDAAKERLAAERIAQLNDSAANNARLAGEANNKAGGAIERAAKLEVRASDLTRQAERLKLEVSKANESAKKADLRAARADLEVSRLKNPRTLHDKVDLIGRMKVFSGAEYDFESVFQDTESVDLLIDLDRTLTAAGWIRRKGPIGFPPVPVWGESDAVRARNTTGITIAIEESGTWLPANTLKERLLISL